VVMAVLGALVESWLGTGKSLCDRL